MGAADDQAEADDELGGDRGGRGRVVLGRVGDERLEFLLGLNVSAATDGRHDVGRVAGDEGEGRGGEERLRRPGDAESDAGGERDQEDEKVAAERVGDAR